MTATTNVPDWLQKVQVALPTSFDEEGDAIVPEPFGDLVSRLADAGVDVFLPGAANGEFHSLTVEETITCVRLTRAACGDKGFIVAPIGFDLKRSLQLMDGAAKAGANAYLYMPPVHPYLSDMGFEDLMSKIGQASSLPLTVYKKGPVPSDALLSRLLQDGIIQGIKYSGSDPAAVANLVRTSGGQGRIICGTGERLAPFFGLAGAVGFSSGAANIAPRLALRLSREIRSGDYRAAMATLELLRPLEEFRARDADSYNVCALKHAVKQAGIDVGPARPPQRKLTAAEREELTALVQGLLAAEGAAAGSN